MADKYIKDLTVTTDSLVNADYMLVEKADNSGTKISQFSNVASSVANKILVNNRTTTESGYALDARQGKAIDNAFLRGRGNVSDISSTLAEDDLIGLAPGAYLYNTAYSWLPSGAGQYGTILSIQDSQSGAAGYGCIYIIDIAHNVFFRHHSSTDWHKGWAQLPTNSIIKAHTVNFVDDTSVITTEFKANSNDYFRLAFYDDGRVSIIRHGTSGWGTEIPLRHAGFTGSTVMPFAETLTLPESGSTSSNTPNGALQEVWSNVPNDRPLCLRINASGGALMCYGWRYSDKYGAFLYMKYNGPCGFITVNNNTFTLHAVGT